MGRARVNLLDFDEPMLKQWFLEQGESSFRAKQLIKWLHQRQELDFNLMTDLSKSLRTKLAEDVVLSMPKIVTKQCSADGTRKWLLQLDLGNNIETVYIPEGKRGTLCISSQVGCALNCTFCATATQGFNRNLKVSEIIGQVWQAKKDLIAENAGEITNIVFMGMGEPLLNYEAVVQSIRLLLSDDAYGLSKYRVTVSTSGLVPQIIQLKDEVESALAISLHATYDELRNELVPINKKYPLKVLLAACRDYFKIGSKRHITFEYVMLDKVNDSVNEAKSLVRILSGIRAKINLIPFNPFPGTKYRCSSPKNIIIFRDILTKSGFIATIRKTRGDDIAAACGQLVGEFKDRTKRSLKMGYTKKPVQINNLFSKEVCL